MPSEIISQQQVLWDGFNLTTSLYSVVVGLESEAVDDTTLGDNNRSNAIGLDVPGIQIEGYYDDAVYDEALAYTIGTQDILVSVLRSGTAGARAWFLKAMHASYEPVKGSVGELAGFSAGGKASKSPIVRGKVLGYETALTATGNSASLQFVGGVSSSQSLWAGLHVFTIDDNAGDTLDVVIESDNDAGFASAVTQITFDQMTDIGSQFKTVAGPITDDYFRASFTVAGTTPSFGAVVLIGVQ